MITLCIPTFNRADFLSRLLNYYANTNYQHSILIGDSSTADHIERNQKTVKSLQDKLKVEYKVLPGLRPGPCLEYLGSLITTPYCAAVSDDDFLCTKSIDRCVEFLESNSDFGAAGGKAAILGTDTGGSWGEVGGCRSYPLAFIQSATGVQRIEEFFNRSYYAVAFSVHRTQNWQEMFKGISGLEGRYNLFRDEITISSISVIQGKIQEIDCLYLVRQAHPGIYSPPSAYDLLVNENWFPSFQFFQERITAELVRVDGVSAEKAQEVIKGVFWPYLARQLTGSWQKHEKQLESRLNGVQSQNTINEHFRNIAKRLPGALRLVRSLRGTKAKLNDSLSLPSLLDSSSPYHEDFMPVYRAVTVAPESAF